MKYETHDVHVDLMHVLYVYSRVIGVVTKYIVEGQVYVCI